MILSNGQIFEIKQSFEKSNEQILEIKKSFEKSNGQILEIKKSFQKSNEQDKNQNIFHIARHGLESLF